jgi:hypothetical protein
MPNIGFRVVVRISGNGSLAIPSLCSFVPLVIVQLKTLFLESVESYSSGIKER